MEEKEHILEILKQVKNALRKKDYVKIKNLSNQVVHSSSIEQDPNIIFTAVIIYSLSKLIERNYYQKYSNWNEFYKDYINAIDRIIRALEKDNLRLYTQEISNVNRLIEKLSGELKNFISDVFRKAKINKASKIYEHGISMSKTAKILGISIWELAEYAGQKKVPESNISITMSIKDRIKLLEDFLSKR
ncbi:MAG: hypothetical protein QXW97_02785 [Candidatus Pacearchaeota archaeon]